MIKVRKEIKEIEIGKLKEYKKNNKIHTEEQISLLVQIIDKFGFTQPLLVDKELNIIAGHGRKLAADKLGMKKVPCLVIDDLSESEVKALRIADNRIAELAETSMLNIKEEYFDLLNEGAGLEFLTGYVEEDFSDLLGEELEEVKEDEFTPPEDVETIQTDIKLGDIIKLGNHRLMCGDSTDIDMVHKLVDGQEITGVHTDPPYGINEEGDRSERGGACQGNKLKNFKDDTIDYAVKAFEIVDGLKVKKQVWWGANYYAHYIPQSNNWLVWDKRVEDNMTDTQSDCELAWVLDGHSSVRIFRHMWKGMIKGSEHGVKRVHPTQKPVALAAWCFDKYDMGNNILDLFGGSGSTMMACEQMRKNCFMMEFEPHYAEVICQRWEKLTGNKREVL